MIRAFVFDLDGTIVKTEQLKAESYARAVAELCGESVTAQEVKAAYADVVGQPRFEVASYLVSRFGLEKAAAARAEELGVEMPWQVLVQLRHANYRRMLDDPAVIRQMQWPNNVALLGYARQVGCRTALATQSPRSTVEQMLDVLGLSDSFDFVATGDDISHGKPDPEIYLLVANALGYAPAEHLVVESSASGIQSAVLAGMHVIAVTTPYSRAAVHRQGLLPEKLIVDDPHELMHTVIEMFDAERERASSPTIAPEHSLASSGPFPPVDARLLPWMDTEKLRLADKVGPTDFGISVLQMMELAGAAIADAVAAYAPPGEVVVLAGGGNNGAGGLCAARHISNLGRFVRVVLGSDHLSAAGQHHLATLHAMGIEPLTEPPDTATVVVDALVGYGLRGALRGRAAELAEWARPRWTLSVDYPSGFGFAGAVRPDVTLTLAMPKRGLEVLERLLVADTGIPEQLWTAIGVKAGRPFTRGRIFEVVGLSELREEQEELDAPRREQPGG